MNAPSAIKAVYSDYRRVKGRKCHQIVLEIPSELWPAAYAFLGEPNIDTSEWFALARLRPELTYSNDEPKEADDEPDPKWAPEHQHPAKHCALVCQRETFWQFLRETRKAHCENEEDAAAYVRHFIGLNSRYDLATNKKALQRWQFLESAYIDWLPRAA